MLADVQGGFVSRDSAEHDYGVVLSDDGTAVDLTATQAWRRQRPDAALFHRHLYRASLD
ncbi:MAG: hypothetical protein JSS43_16375 [Proteobacteria bacterium]|nr:hypothetical protein [Pseudomonadota bacterium]